MTYFLRRLQCSLEFIFPLYNKFILLFYQTNGFAPIISEGGEIQDFDLSEGSNISLNALGMKMIAVDIAKGK